ncbi:MAG: hypothetical protein ABFD45_04885 [Smithella sp.]
MKICKLCQKVFENDSAREKNPAEDIGNLFLESGNETEASEICPDCKEDAGILTLLGFDQ